MATSRETNGSHSTGEKARALPPFYRRPVTVTPAGLKNKSFARQGSLAFARATNSIPLNAIEFALAQRHYPIVFTVGEKPRPLAIVGLKNGENLFVGGEGRWAQRAYVPAYVRRYPFILMNTGKDNQFTLCIDAASELIVEGDANPFFVGGKASNFLQEAGKICGAFQAEVARTEQFCDALAEHKLLEAKGIDIKRGGETRKFGPFNAVDVAKLNALPEAVLVEWHRKSWLPAIYAHLFSLNNWADLAARKASAG